MNNRPSAEPYTRRMGTLPIDRLRTAWLRFVHGTPIDEAAPCGYCRAPVAPSSGYRDNGHAFCNDECARLDFERLA